MFYNVYSDFLREKYGEKVYKLPVNLPVTCPNRDGTVSSGGCIFCSDIGAGFESLSNELTVAEQLRKNMEYIGKKYNAEKFIAYFQNFTNTYMPLSDFECFISQAVLPEIVGIDVSTRPDCVAEEYLDILKKTGKDICIELGLQSANLKTLRELNRGHSLASYISAVPKIKAYGFSVCTHIIADLPYDSTDDVIETAKIISVLGTDFVKIHSLYIPKGCELERLYESGELRLLTVNDYIERCAAFLRHLDKKIVVQRLIGRAPEEDTVIANFNMSWWKIKDMLEQYMTENGYAQGDLYEDFSETAVKRFLNRENV